MHNTHIAGLAGSFASLFFQSINPLLFSRLNDVPKWDFAIWYALSSFSDKLSTYLSSSTSLDADDSDIL